MTVEFNKRTGLPYEPDDLNMRLGNSVVRYNNMPIHLGQFEGLRVIGIDLLSGEATAIALPDAALDITPVPLGYVNLPEGTTYCKRIPHRRYKQGLSMDAFVCLKAKRSPHKILSTPSLGECILGRYPYFRDALQKAVSGVSCAFSRKFAFSKAPAGVIRLEYRGQPVGFYDGALQILPEYQYLKEELEVSYVNP